MFHREPRTITMKFETTDCQPLLKQILLLTEIGMDLRDKCNSGEKYLNYLKSIVCGAERTISALHYTSKNSFFIAHKLLKSNFNQNLPENLRGELEKLKAIIEKQLTNFEDNVDNECLSMQQISEKINALEMRLKNSENNILQGNTSSTRSFKIEIDEKYPENISRESLIDLNSIANLPTVPEDIFTSFSSGNKPTRSSSLSSLKSMRKIKLFLQKAESSDDEDSSDIDENDYSRKGRKLWSMTAAERLVYGDNDDSKTSGSHSPTSKKLILGNIKEEGQD